MARALRPMVEKMVEAGYSAEKIVTLLAREGQEWAVRDAIRNARDYLERSAGVQRHGPWPVSYVRATGERVFRVGPGHDIPEGSLKALGFFLPEGA